MAHSACTYPANASANPRGRVRYDRHFGESDPTGGAWAGFPPTNGPIVEWVQESEYHIYGSSRVGVRNAARVLQGGYFTNPGYELNGAFKPYTFNANTYSLPAAAPATVYAFTRGRVRYEVTNHLGNVLATISDRKRAFDDNTNGLIDRYAADVWSYSDYYPFGSLMPGRHATLGGDGYRYGFNGKEGDSEVYGEGNNYDFGARIYDARIGRWLSVDAHTSKEPGVSPYVFCFSSPILFVDPDGNDGRISVSVGQDGSVMITVSTTIHVFGDKVTDDLVNWMQDKFNSLNNEHTLDPSETNGVNVTVRIEVLYRNASGDIPDDQFKSQTSGLVHKQYINSETKQKMGWQDGDNTLLVDKGAWRTFLSGPLAGRNEAGFTHLLGSSAQVDPMWTGGALSFGNDVAQHEVMHMLGFDERYNPGINSEHPGFEGDVQSGGQAVFYIHPQHFYDIYNYAKRNDLLANGSSRVMQENLDGTKDTFDNTQSGREEVPSNFNRDGTKKN